MTNTQTTIVVTPESGKYFMRGVQAAKKYGGKFDGYHWVLPAQFWIESAEAHGTSVASRLRTYYLQLVPDLKGGICNLYTRDQGCPLHGETCAPERR